MSKITHILFCALVFVLFSCEKENNTAVKSSTSFSSLSNLDTGIDFSNTIIENDTLNYFEFPYMYMGGGVAIGDINNDGLSDVYFTGNMSDNKLYLNKGNMKFEDITKSAKVSGDNRWYTGVTMADVNADGWLDIYVSVSGIYGTTKNQLFINNHDNTFTEKAEAYGLDDETTSIQATFFDYNSDGLQDVFVANYPTVKVSMGNKYYHQKMLENKLEDSGHLYRNNGDNTFSDVTAESGVQNFGMTLGVVASDYNNDGFQDLYLSNDFNVPDYFYLNNGDGTFKEVVKDATNHTAMFGMGIDVADFNNDNLLDIIQLDMTPADYKRSKTNMASMNPETFYEAIDLGLHYQYMQNALQVNNGINKQGIPMYSDISRLTSLATTDWSWGTLFADFDNDGLKDVIITNGMKRDVNNNDVNQRTKTTSFADFNKAIDYKQYPSTPIDNYVFKNDGDYGFSRANDIWNISYKGFSNGVSYGDLDNDGDLDIVINNLGDMASVFENEKNNQLENNYFKIKLNGTAENALGLGAKIYLTSKQGKQFQEFTLTRGFQSSVEPVLHFGLGKDTTIDTLFISWANGKGQKLTSIKANQLLEIDIKNAEKISEIKSSKTQIFKDITERSGIAFKHTEDSYDDFELEPLLPHKNSQLGAALTVGDINGDGLEDFFVGNAAGSKSEMYIQNTSGSFEVLDGPWYEDFQNEDTGALLFDADGDGDLDLYVVSGGNDPTKPAKYYQDRLYVNTTNGFIKSTKSLPKVNSSGLVVISEDYDNDGDFDLFVGGRIFPGKYPFPAKSYILRNDGGKDEFIKYTDVTKDVLPTLTETGLVTSALWDDFNNDGKVDLIVTGEWMPIRFFENTGKSFKEVTNHFGFENKTGWWNCIEKVDYDNDGDLDYLAGNLGLNYKYKAKKEAPFEVYANDFDENGSMDIVLTSKKKGIQLPLRGRECSSQQVPAIKKRFETFELFANATLADIYGQAMLDKSLHYQVNTFANSWIENKGDGNFTLHELPTRVQFSSINDLEVFKFGDSGVSDILVGGNLYQSEVETPRNDASYGLLFSGSSNPKEVVLQNNYENGLFIKGEIKSIQTIRIEHHKTQAVLFLKNNDSLKLLEIKLKE
ncbi:VCBS repeat-containing protein [Algibacter sp. Ld11]|uniref:VCBS repeat-containing protein n=1 Tax=Algibacter sp. Ld11 TaxID=649150 RepID=UPI0038655B2D